MASKGELLGKKISLLALSNIRYVGTLTKVDKKEKSMTLINVSTLGTEGRREGVDEIPAQDNIVETIKFKVADIQKFDVIREEEPPKEE